MKPEIVEYAVIRVVPDLRRGESVNIGVVAFLPGRLDIRILPSLHKVAAIDPALDLEDVRGWIARFDDLVAVLPTTAERHAVLRQLGNVQLSDLGCFRLARADDYDREIAGILDDLVVPPVKPRRNEPATRLEAAIRNQFAAQRMLGRSLEDISDHKIVPRFPVAAGGKLSVDFALRNGGWHVTETIDFSGAPETLHGAKFQQAAVKSITLDAATRKLEGDVIPLVVYQALSDEILELVQPSIDLLSDYAERLYNYADPDQRSAYFDRMGRIAGQIL
jgi:hypothetical protein